MNDSRIGDIKRWIIEHFASVRDVEEVAREFHTNPETLRRQFRRVEGRSMGQFISRERVKEAMTLARDSELLQKEIVRETGLGTADNLARLFRRVAGMTFSTYCSRYHTLKR
jgi:AraC-like DNA-binding protein